MTDETDYEAFNLNSAITDFVTKFIATEYGKSYQIDLMRRDEQEVELLLKCLLSAGVVNERNETALHVAAKCYDMRMVRLLLDHLMKDSERIDNHSDDDGVSLFHIVCASCNSSHVADFIERVPGVDVNRAISSNSKYFPGCNPLHIAASFYNYDTFKILIELGASVGNKTLTKGLTALHLVCKMDNCWWLDKESVSDFVSRPCNLKRSKRFAKYFEEIRDNRIKIINALLTSGCDIDARDSKGANALMYAVRNNYELALFWLVSDGVHRLLLFWDHATFALSGMLVKIVETLLAHYDSQRRVPNLKSPSSPLNSVDNRGWSCLHYLADFGVSDENVVKYVIDHGVNVNALDHRFVTPLHMAVKNRQKSVIEALLLDYEDKKCEGVLKVNVQDNAGNTILHTAIEMMLMDDNNSQCVAQSFGLALEYGADIDIENEAGVSVMMLIKHRNLRVLRENELVEEARCRDADAIWIDRVSATVIWQRLLMLRLCDCYTDKSHGDVFDRLSKELLVNDEIIEASRFRLLCENEVREMRSIRINSYASLDCLISRSIDKVAAYTRSDELVGILDSPDFEEKFTFYAKHLKSRYVRGLNRRELLDRAQNSLQYLIGEYDLPDLCLDRVLSYLSEKKLRDVIDAGRNLPVHACQAGR